MTPNAAWGGEGRYVLRAEGCRVGPGQCAWTSGAPWWGREPGPGPADPVGPSQPLAAISGRGWQRQEGLWEHCWTECFWPSQSGLWYRLWVPAPDPNPACQPPQEATRCSATRRPAAWTHPPGLSCPAWPAGRFPAGGLHAGTWEAPASPGKRGASRGERACTLPSLRALGGRPPLMGPSGSRGSCVGTGKPIWALLPPRPGGEGSSKTPVFIS